MLLSLNFKNIHSTKEMSLPVRPPTFLRAFPALLAAFEIPDPAELVTFDRPSEAFEMLAEAVSFAFAAVSAAVEACRNCALKSCRDCRRTSLEAIVVDMAAESEGWELSSE